jgi:hypothetical protein
MAEVRFWRKFNVRVIILCNVPSVVSGEDLVPLRVIKEGASLEYVRINILGLTENMLYCFFWMIPRRLYFFLRRFGKQ